MKKILVVLTLVVLSAVSYATQAEETQMVVAPWAPTRAPLLVPVQHNGLATELSAPSVSADATPPIIKEKTGWDSLYFGVGLIELKSEAFPVNREEAGYILDYNGVRTESPRRLAKNIMFGFKTAKVPTSFEVSYTFDDPGASSETKGIWNAYDYFVGRYVSVPLSVQHKETFSALNFSAVGEHALSDDVYLVGKFGYSFTQVVTETRSAYACTPAHPEYGYSGCPGYSGLSSTVNDTSITYAVGIKMKVANRSNGPVWTRLMVEKLPNGFLTSRADVLFSF